MGQELACRMHYNRRTLTGKAYLETDHILFRGDERVKIALKDLKSATAQAGVLTLDFPGGPAALELGAAAEKWADKILHPPTRADKLGIKPGSAVCLIGDFETEFVDEAVRQASRPVLRTSTGKVDLLFYLAPDRKALARVSKLISSLKPAGALWIVYPKGVQTIREVEVIEAGRAAGLKDVKVASFSATHTALKFVIPVQDR
jgi:hypothetical protein